MKTLHWRPLKDNQLRFQSLLANLALLPVVPFVGLVVGVLLGLSEIREELGAIAKAFVYDRPAIEAKAVLDALRYSNGKDVNTEGGIHD